MDVEKQPEKWKHREEPDRLTARLEQHSLGWAQMTELVTLLSLPYDYCLSLHAITPSRVTPSWYCQGWLGFGSWWASTWIQVLRGAVPPVIFSCTRSHKRFVTLHREVWQILKNRCGTLHFMSGEWPRVPCWNTFFSYEALSLTQIFALSSLFGVGSLISGWGVTVAWAAAGESEAAHLLYPGCL